MAAGLSTAAAEKAIQACLSFSEKQPSMRPVSRPPGRPPKDPTKRKQKFVEYRNSLSSSQPPTTQSTPTNQNYSLRSKNEDSDISILFNLLHEIASDVKETRQIVGALQSVVADLQPRMEVIETTIGDFNERLDGMESAVGELMDTNTNKGAGIMKITEGPNNENAIFRELQDQIADMQRQQTKNKIVISGEAVTSFGDEQPASVAIGLLSKIEDYTPDSSQIEHAHFLGNQRSKIALQMREHSSTRSIFTKFFKMETKPFYLNEFILPKFAKVHYKLRQLKKQFPNVIKSVFIKRGLVCCSFEGDGDVMNFITCDDVASLGNRLLRDRGGAPGGN